MSSLSEILIDEPAYRRKQIEKAWFDVSVNSYDEISTLPVALREKLKNIPWLSLEIQTLLTSKLDNTRKILFKLNDGNFIETVIMGRTNIKADAVEGDPDRYTICISSQAGCPMRCVFCATGKAGFKRNLTAEEIIDQIRYCQRILSKENAKIKNVVLMGQGEPLLNYENVKRALNVILQNTDIGETKITISTAGVASVMEQAIEDTTFPKVRWAISLHSAIEETRKKIMPSHQKGFLDFLVKWAKNYHEKVPSRSHFIGFEYLMLGGINDDDKHLKALITLCKKMPHLRINLIPYNGTDVVIPLLPRGGEGELPTFTRSSPEHIDAWHEALMKAGFTSTIRYSQGQDIMAACGQLSNRQIACKQSK